MNDKKYRVTFDSKNGRFDTNQQIVYECMRDAGLDKIMIAGIMGNIEAESRFSTAMSGDQGSAGICQWLNGRRRNLEKFAGSKDVTDIRVQAEFILEECKQDSPYRDGYAVKCYHFFTDPNTAIYTAADAADYFTALYERCYFRSTWAGVTEACNKISWLSEKRFSKIPNAYNGKYYLDTPKRRGYAEEYFNLVLKN